LQAHSIDDHISSSTPPVAYVALGDQDNLTPAAQWRKEEAIIKSAMGPMLLDAAFLKVKAMLSVKDAWDGLKELYENRTKALVTDTIQRFQNKWCEEDESIHSHFKYLADLCEQLTGMG
jgi:gag-polypeptide of LTR copia-type